MDVYYNNIQDSSDSSDLWNLKKLVSTVDLQNRLSFNKYQDYFTSKKL